MPNRLFPLPAPPWFARSKAKARRRRDERNRLLASLLGRVTDDGMPNITPLAAATWNHDILALNVKALGYELARMLVAMHPAPTETAARHVGLRPKLSTQADLESDWAAHWLGELKIPLLFHRKLWEFAFVLQALHDAGVLTPGKRGLGFGCGNEPMASYLASRGVATLITDLDPEDRRAEGWAATGQHTASLDQAWHPHLVDRAVFDAHVRFQSMDMTRIDPDLENFDFCWSICAMEHLGSIEAGLAFVENSLRPLRPGGVAVHTGEFNINPEGPTTDNWMTVLFQRRHMEEVSNRLRRAGHHVAPFDYDPGDKPLDRFIDVPPWHDGLWEPLSRALPTQQHLKVAVDGFVATCLGIIVVKAGLSVCGSGAPSSHGYQARRPTV